MVVFGPGAFHPNSAQPNGTLDRVRALSLPFANKGDANAYAVAEHGILLMPAARRNLPALDRMGREGRWLRIPPATLRGPCPAWCRHGRDKGQSPRH